MSIRVKAVGILGLTAILAAAACVSTSVIAGEIHKESQCKGTDGGNKAYKWAWSTAVAGGVTSGACVTGIILMFLA
jgi:hypothetical protein